MLVDVRFGFVDPGLALVLGMISEGKGSVNRLQQGVYTCGHWSFDYLFRRRSGQHDTYDLDYPEIPAEDPEWRTVGFPPYGVCDGWEQLEKILPPTVLEGPRTFCVSLVPVRKSQQPESGGWRWHKWGPYVGEQEPTTEYLYDEPKIEEVWTYHIYEVRPEEQLDHV